MEIAVVRYGEDSREVTDNVAVLDTTTGRINICEARQDLSNFNEDRNKIMSYHISHLLRYYPYSFIHMQNNFLHIGDTIINLGAYEHIFDRTLNFAYPFLYKDYIVLRFCSPDYFTDIQWGTVVIGKHGGTECYWTKDMSVLYGDKGIAIKIDMTSEA